jgi:hypothetical protein
MPGCDGYFRNVTSLFPGQIEVLSLTWIPVKISSIPCPRPGFGSCTWHVHVPVRGQPFKRLRRAVIAARSKP